MDKKQKILIAGAALFAALFLFSSIVLAWQYRDGKRAPTLLKRWPGWFSLMKRPSPVQPPAKPWTVRKPPIRP